MTDRANILNRSSGVAAEGKQLPMIRPDNKRPNPNNSNDPAGKRPKTDPSSGSSMTMDPEVEALLAKVSKKPDDERKRALRTIAQTMVMSLSMTDLNHYLQYIKKTVESKKQQAKKGGDKDKASNGSKEGARPGQAGNGGVSGAGGNNAAAPPSPSDNEGSADGNKPTLSGAFYPLANVSQIEEEGTGSIQKKLKEEQRAFVRKKADKRTAEEEGIYQDLLHGLAEKQLIVDDVLVEERFEEVLKEALNVAKKLKDWFQIWSHGQIRPEHTKDCCVFLTNYLCKEGQQDEEEIADILSHLMKEKEISPKHMEDSIKEFQMGEDGGDPEKPKKELWKLIGHLLVYIYPTSKNDFGWHRVGWGFAQWWQHVKKYTKDLDNPLEALKLCTSKLLEYKSDLASSAEKQEKLLTRATELLGTREEAVKELGINGDPGFKPSPSPITSDE